jgi:uncharacterized protein
MRKHPNLVSRLPVLVGLLVVGVTGWLTAAPAAAQEAPAGRPTITVTGEGSVQVKPDIARFVVATQTTEKDVTTAVAENAKRADAIVKAVKDAGVAEKDIQTVTYNIYPAYEQEPPRPGEVNVRMKLVGYTVNNALRVTVRKIGDAGRLLDAATKAGANSSGGLAFELSDESEEKARQEALTLAVKQARSKAVTVAKASQAGQITLISITEGSAAVPRPVPVPMMADTARGFSNTPVMAGELTVRAAVTLQYAFDPTLKPNYE